jgi:hypothetical protein
MFDRSYDSAARKRKSCVSSERSVSSAEGPVLGITSSSTSAMVIKVLQRFDAKVCCPSGVLSKIDVVVGATEKSEHGAHGTSPPACGTSTHHCCNTTFNFLRIFYPKRKLAINFQVKRKVRSSLFDFTQNHTMSSSQEDELLSIVSHFWNGTMQTRHHSILTREFKATSQSA